MQTRLTQFATAKLGILSLGLLVLPRTSRTASADAVGRSRVASGATQPEVYDPASNTFQAVSGNTLNGCCFSTATLLLNGDVLLARDYNTSTWVAVNHAWLYQP